VLIDEVWEVKRLEGEGQVGEAQKRRGVAARCPGAGDLKVESAWGAKTSTFSRLAPSQLPSV